MPWISIEPIDWPKHGTATLGASIAGLWLRKWAPATQASRRSDLRKIAERIHGAPQDVDAFVGALLDLSDKQRARVLWEVGRMGEAPDVERRRRCTLTGLLSRIDELWETSRRRKHPRGRVVPFVAGPLRGFPAERIGTIVRPPCLPPLAATC